MDRTSGHKIFAVWLLLIAATLLSWFLGTGHGLTADGDYTLATVTIIIVAGVKIRLVGLWFMELREAVLWLRMVYELYVVSVCSMMLWFYLVSAPTGS